MSLIKQSSLILFIGFIVLSNAESNPSVVVDKSIILETPKHFLICEYNPCVD
jgi:hypothetical protein